MTLNYVIQFCKKYFTVELVVFFYFYGFLMNLPILTIYVYERISDEKGFPYQNLSQAGDGSGCGGDSLGQNSTLWELEQEVSRHTYFYWIVFDVALFVWFLR